MSTGTSKKLGKGNHLYLIDGSGYIFRAYYALPPLNRKSDGLPTGAVAGFCNMLYKLLEDTKDGDQPSHLAVIFDTARKTFRSDIYPEYKANRSAPPEDLIPQFPLIRDAVRAFNVPSVELAGFEADDLIATYTRQAVERGATVTIVSSDKDLMQLVGPGVDMFDPMKNKRVREPEVEERFGVGPERVVDVQSLAGDSTDNVPGVPGIGVKTAAELIRTYGSLDEVLARAEEIKQPKRRERLIEHADDARMSRELVKLADDAPVEESIDSFEMKEPEAKTVIPFLKAMELNTLTRRLADALDADAEAFEADAELTKPGAGAADKSTTKKDDGGKDAKKKSAKKDELPSTPGAVPEGVTASLDQARYTTVTELDDLDAWIDAATEAGAVAVDTETTSLDAMQARLVGISLAIVPGEACYIPLGHGAGDELSLDGAADVAQIPLAKALKRLKPLLEDDSVLKIGQNIKYDFLILAGHGIRLHPIDDTMLLSYALDAGLHGHGMDELSQIHLGHKPIPFKEMVGSGKSQITFDKVPVDKATQYAAEDADVTLRLHALLKPRLPAERLTTVYETLERPLVPVLCDMERAGIKVDRQVLSRLSGEFAQTMGAIESEAHKLAGEPFNLGSPKQLGEILFEKLGIESGKKTKTGAFATGADVLEDLAAQGHELPAKVLQWRQLSKLKGTYTDALPEHIHPETGRVHTSYSMAATSTGRLASSDPNLQNIPIRTEEGRKIRQAFIAEKGNQLISADYSQIELRLLAEIADIPALKEAFASGLDIHAMTASEVFGVPLEDMDAATRRRAKAINFGIIYGISAFGLANQLGISRGEAANFINVYFERFPGIRDYMDETKEFCRKNGYVETAFGRKCHMPGINEKNGARRSFMERAAINAPLQGTAADIIRRAMIRMPSVLTKAKLSARMLLQVHDELIFEAPKEEVAETCDVVTRVMEDACRPALELSVPLTVEANAALTWDDAH